MLASSASVSLIQSAPASLVRSSPERNSVEQLYCFSSIRNYKAKDAIFYEGDDSDHLFEVIAGVVKLCKLTSDGRCQITGFLYPGQLLGLERTGTYFQTAEAVTKAKIRRYPRATIENLLDLDPNLRKRLMTSVLNELAAAQDQILLPGCKSAIQKVASFLLRFSEHSKDFGEDTDWIYMPLRRRDIAEYLGLSSETISRMLGRLKKQKIVSTLCGGKRIMILDDDSLLELAEGDMDL